MKGTINIQNSTLDTPGHITSQQLKEMADSGIIEVGSHTYNLAGLKTQLLQKQNETNTDYEKRIYNDFLKSRKELSAITGKEVNILALPFGTYNESIINMARKAGFTMFLGSDEGANPVNFCKNTTILKRIKY